jgi:predicted ATPase/DNA-binding SARP family transcriptional activator
MADVPVKIQCFGQFDVQVVSKSASGVPKQSQELLARLATSGSRGADRGELAASLWPEADQERAQFYLRRSLSQLRTIFDADRWRFESVDDGRISLNLSDCWCDVAEYDRLSKRSEFGDLAKASSLYTGEFLSGHRSEWCRQMRDVYRDRQLLLLGKLAASAEQSGDLAVAREWLAKAALLDPVREETIRRLMRLLREMGEYAALAQAYRDLRLTMRQTMGLSPSRETIDLYRELLSDARLVATAREEPTAVAAAPKMPLPVPATPFVGRAAELAEIGALLNEHRLLTITGLGGVGKSRLTIQLAVEVAPQFKGGVAYANFSGASDTSDAADRVLRALGIDDLDASLSAMTKDGAEEVLLLLDNVEQVASPCADLISGLLEKSKAMRILCASQIPTRCDDERTFNLLPMKVPLKNEEAAESEAVQFFLKCAQRAAPAFKLGPSNVVQVSELCRRLDGLPLALELAAVRLRSLPVADIVSNLDDRFGLLDQSRGPRSGLRTLRGVLEWSLKMLSPSEAKLFARLAVFPASWTMAAAQAICSDEQLSAKDVFHALTSLVDHSLVNYETVGDGGMYRMLETVRSYSRDQLEADRELLGRLSSRHARYYLDASGSVLFGAEDRAVFFADQPNCSMAIDHFLESSDDAERQNALRLVNRLFPLWIGFFSFGDALRTALRTIEAFDETPRGPLAETLFRAAGAASSCYRLSLSSSLFVRAEAMADALGLEAWSTESVRGRAELAANEGRLEEAERLLLLALERYRQAEDSMGQAHCLGSLGYIKREFRQFEEARSLTEAALAISTKNDDLIWKLWCLGSLAAIHIAANEPERAIPILLETLAHQEREGNVPAQTWNRTTLGVAYMESGALNDAQVHLERVVGDIGSDLEDLRTAWPRIELGELYRLQGRYEDAKRILEEAFRTSRASGSTVLQAKTLVRLSAVALDMDDLIHARAYRAAASEILENIQAPVLLDDLNKLDSRLRSSTPITLPA